MEDVFGGEEKGTEKMLKGREEMTSEGSQRWDIRGKVNFILIINFNVCLFFFFQAEDGIRDHCVTGVQTCALPI